MSLHFNGANSFLFVNGTEIHKFKAKDSDTVASTLCLGNISEDFAVDDMKKKQDYDATPVDDILDIHKYLMEKSGIV